jgi:hypothetical protein
VRPRTDQAAGRVATSRHESLCLKEIRISDDLSKTGPQDRSRINLHEEHEVRYWTEVLGVSKAELEQAVKEAGSSVSALSAKLGK